MTDNATRVTVIGAGKMGLPLACVLASGGARVTVCDVDHVVVEEVNRGNCPFDEPGVAELLGTMVRSGSLCATTDTATAVSASEVVVVLVPVLLTDGNRADMSIIAPSGIPSDIASAGHDGVDGDYPPGGRDTTVWGIVERGGLRAGVDFDLVFSQSASRAGSSCATSK